MRLTGDSLSKRQQDLNYKVIHAADKKVSFDEVKAEPEMSDVDKLFKIDLASKYKNIDYIFEVLKSGDSLHISRALKCVWLYDDEYASVINPDYLNQNIFPLMSLKMKRKMLSTISTYVRNETRVNSFYEYCTALQMSHLASKFLNFTSEAFKLDLVHNNIENVNARVHDYENFFRHSFKLADAFLNKKPEWSRLDCLYELRYLFSVCNIKYLELLEKYGCHGTEFSRRRRLGHRTSEIIMTKYKQRVMKNTFLYVNILNIKRFVRYTTTSEAKMYLAALLPNELTEFWDANSWNNDADFCKTYSFIINLIPAAERYRFLKKIFNEKYPLEPFEMNIIFYNLNYFNYMTIEEREIWALSHVESKKELHGEGQDYIWYRFISFEVAFSAIKKYILITPDSSKRTTILNILVESARNQRELEKLFNYYYEKHLNECDSYNKQRFLDKVIEHHSREIFEFDDSCWTAFSKLLHNRRRRTTAISYRYKPIALIYHVIHEKALPNTLKKFADSLTKFSILSSVLYQINTEKQEIMYQYLLQLMNKRLEKFECKIYNDDLKNEIEVVIEFVLDVLKYFKKPEGDRPEIVTKYMNLDSETFFPEKDSKVLTQGLLLRILKQDASLVFEKLSHVVKYNMHSYQYFNNINRLFKLNQLLRKLRIYFVDEIAKKYLTFFTELLSQPLLDQKNITLAVYGVFQIADENFKHDFMMKYIPADAKVNHSEINRTVLYIQEAICRFAGYSRPPIPLSIMSKYIKGDYLQYCLPLFNLYLANLPLPLCLEFVTSLLDTPVSIQKHGLRLAFQCFQTDDIKKLLLRAWKNTKNISLRSIIYIYLCNFIQKQDTSTQTDLFEVLKIFIQDLKPDDHIDVMSRKLYINIPYHLSGEYLVIVWSSVNKFPNNSINLDRKTKFMDNITENIDLVAKDAIKQIVNEHVHDQLTEKHITQDRELNNAKWQLVLTYIVKYDEDEENKWVVLELTASIINKYLKMWNEVHVHDSQEYEAYVMRKFCLKFVSDLLYTFYKRHVQKNSYTYINPIIDSILSDLLGALPIQEIYVAVWELRLAVITNKVIDEGRDKISDTKIIDKSDGIKGMIKNYATEVGGLIKEFVEKDIYYTTFFYKISAEVKRCLRYILAFLIHYERNLCFEEVCVLLCTRLTNYKMVETVLLAVSLLPTRPPPKCHSEFEMLIGLIKMFDNSEIKCLMYKVIEKSGFRKSLR